MNQQPLVSIIIPTYNRAHLIGETLDSVLAQTYPNWECIIVDDGSTDTTDIVVGSYVERDARFQYHHRPADRPKGANACRNYGFELSKGEYIQWLDSDDLLATFCLNTRVKTAIENNSFDMLICLSAAFKNELNDNCLLWNSINNNENIEDLLFRFFNGDMPFHTNGVLWNRIFLKNILWNESLQAWQDWEFHIRALLENARIKIFINKPDNYYRMDAKESIASGKMTTQYFISIITAIKSVEQILIEKGNYSKFQSNFKYLIYRSIFNYPIQLGYWKKPMVFFRNDISFQKTSKRHLFFVYIFELLCSRTIIKKFLKHNLQMRYFQKIKPKNTFLKLSYEE